MSKKGRSGTKTSKIITWLNTEEGRKALESCRQNSDEAIKKFKASCQVDSSMLYEPFGPLDGDKTWSHQQQV